MKSLKEKAISYRKNGYSYNMISQKLGLNKSTLSNWLNRIPFFPNKEVAERINQAKLKSALFKQRQKLNEIKEMKELADKEIGKISNRDLWLLGLGLYLGEGCKSYEIVGFSNSDPEIIKIIIKWFKKICHLRNENFNPYIHIYPDNNVAETINYWSKTIGVPRDQFGKPIIDKRLNKARTKRKILPYGTLDIRIKSHGEREFGRRLHRKIVGWIESTIKQTTAGVV